MSKFEIILIVLACAVPIMALIFVAPKFKKKEKKKEAAPIKTYEEMKKEESPKEEVKQEFKPAKKTVSHITNTDFGPSDFRTYLQHKQKNLSRPNRIDLPAGFQDRTTPYNPRRRRRMEEKPKTVAEEIRSLSPELKALIFSGALDKKKYD